MAITREGTNTTGTGTAKPLQFNHTLVAGSDRLIVVYVGVENANETGTWTVTYGGQTMDVSIEAQQGTGFANNALVCWLGESGLPSNGVNQVSISFSGTAGSLEINGECAQYAGVDTSAVSDSDTANSASQTSISNTITVAADDLVASTCSLGASAALSWDNSQNELTDFTDSSSQFGSADLIATGSLSSVNTSWSGTVNRQARAAGCWSPASAGPPTITDVGDEGFFNGETGVVITGTSFGSPQGSGGVTLNSASDGSGTSVGQTETLWGDTSITITVVQGALSNGTVYVFVTNDDSQTNATGYAVTLDTRPTITNADDEGFFPTETGIVITGTNFKSSQGDGTVSINSAADGSGTNVAQTVSGSGWSNTSIEITIVQGALSLGTNYIIVQNSNEVETAGYQIELATRPTITDADDEVFYDDETGIDIDGANYETDQGTGYVELNSASDGSGTSVTQTVTSWGASQITITADIGGLTEGTNYLIVHTDSNVESAGYSVAIYPRPTITDAEDELFYDGETTVVIDGTNFNATQSGGTVELNTQADGGGSSQSQTITNWNDSQITLTTINQGGLSSGTLYLIVTDTYGAPSVGYSVAVYPRPTITDADDEDFYHGETGVDIDGTDFGAVEGTVELNTQSDGG